MGGICGIVSFDGAEIPASSVLAMLAAQRERGPDGRAGWAGGAAAFGQSRLVTVAEHRLDLEPWVHEASGFVVVTDSRLDNRDQLLRDLAISDPAESVGDARIVHEAFQRWGEDCVNHLLGDFAIAVWDSRARRLFLARDVVGVRPLCFHLAPGQLLAFASSPVALLALPAVPDDLDEGRIADSFVYCLEAIDETSTMFSAIQRLPPAHRMMVESGGSRSDRYWTPVMVRPDWLPKTEAEWIEGLREHLAEAVRCRMRSCVAVGSMLSGGLDSSSIVALASAEFAATGMILPTYSAVSGRAECAESAAISVMRRAFELESTCVEASDAEALLDQVAAGWATLGQPFDAWNTLVECMYISAGQAGTRVLLDGLDADSLLSEGDLAGELLRGRQWRQLWRELRGSAAIFGWPSSLSVLRPELSRRLVPQGVRDRLAPLRARREAERLARSSLLNRHFAERIDLEGRLAVRASAGHAASRTDGDRSAQSCVGLTTITAGIERYDRLAARHSVEPRHPFLDRRLVEFCAWMPLGLRQRDGWPKWALRRAMEGVLPREVAWRKGKEHLGSEFSWHLGAAPSRRSAIGAGAKAYISDPVSPCFPDASLNFTSVKEGAWEPALFLSVFRAWMDGNASRHRDRA